MRSWLRASTVTLALLAGAVAACSDDPPGTTYNRPSGFWTSNRPAVGGAYRYRLLLIGIAIALVMGLVMVRVIRKARSQRRDP
jgi:hypothetical protein